MQIIAEEVDGAYYIDVVLTPNDMQKIQRILPCSKKDWRDCRFLGKC
jgi:hypothetical protein